VRISVGLEAADDLWRDLLVGLDAAAALAPARDDAVVAAS
jgi:hypothetical protein